jgi:chromosome segregation ATPase
MEQLTGTGKKADNYNHFCTSQTKADSMPTQSTTDRVLRFIDALPEHTYRPPEGITVQQGLADELKIPLDEVTRTLQACRLRTNGYLTGDGRRGQAATYQTITDKGREKLNRGRQPSEALQPRFNDDAELEAEEADAADILEGIIGGTRKLPKSVTRLQALFLPLASSLKAARLIIQDRDKEIGMLKAQLRGLPSNQQSWLSERSELFRKLEAANNTITSLEQRNRQQDQAFERVSRELEEAKALSEARLARIQELRRRFEP